jgi:type VI secretion system protein ImpF
MQAKARALLFDRLVDLDPRTPTEPAPLRALSMHQLRESVRREVGRLLNTRCPYPTSSDEKAGRTVLDYGLEDFSAFSPQSPADQRRIASILQQAIEAFEPRLRQVRITVERFIDNKKALLAHLDAQLVVETVAEPISFPVYIQSTTGKASVDEREHTG